ncbi:uncharacterized protein METZ01_LOCUS159068 [marine metagenome]|uniref:Uncharacterized protein n=1 Tax=marine metagenome TaxID=408172 RepID=A0A382AXU9_9ZZZZ
MYHGPIDSKPHGQFNLYCNSSGRIVQNSYATFDTQKNRTAPSHAGL